MAQPLATALASSSSDGTDEIREHPAHLPINLHNSTCVYCGVVLTTDNTTKEHVIGRRFVPKGKLDGWWNLIVRACETCNRIKRDLEDDISAITMAPDAGGRLTTHDPIHQIEAVRKGHGSFSRRTGKLVADSTEQIKVEAPLGPGRVRVDFTAPPQIAQERLFHLARWQIRAFFYLLTYDESKKTGKFWHEGCYFVAHATRSDWGNALIRGFAGTVRAWEPRLVAIGADGFFRVAIRRHPTAGCFSWALEWNQNYRIVGFFGDRKVADDLFNALPALETHTITEGEGHYFRIRKNVALKDEEDSLFEVPT